MQTPHDKFFKRSMERKETAKDLLEHFLSSELLAELDMDSLRIEKESFVDEELAEHFSDIVYRTNIKGKESYLCFIFEHKSYRYSDITLQLLRYMLNIWSLKREQDTEELPVIVPMLIYHGAKTWNIGLKLSDLVEEVPEEVERYLPDFEYILLDLSGYNKGEIQKICQMRVFIEVLAAVYKDDFEERLFAALKVLDKLEKENKAVGYFKIILRYIIETDAVDTSLEDVKRISERVSKEKGGAVMSIAQELKEEGIKEGRKEELQETLFKLLSRKLGMLPKDYRISLKELEKEELEVVRDAIFDIEKLDDLDKYLN
ncbi:Rpn family recombination-promoting nuclease/putative transposase [Fuchsiella alkaliacetigena]|uniref:Rpn family recombination-promoting nuclease/putative transposase n=1 Tax=Fuchsiella alkaliacetigena TaxID=957042 RepID=UPI00200A07B3|nr:Rpn family recombination-promoting nuclease/putative transposase [Fuchsiella alkaliacetigena]MCK8825652.1 Rpn family recombination-promoting nuclease/putative transposase [Fuchsiella alkaliacetigena]